ncbi:MAG: outer membrane protein [Gemmatimonadota bacterium]
MAPTAPGRGPVLKAFARSLPVALVLATAVPAPAQRSDFLFGRPDMTVTGVAGWALPGEGSDLFSFTREQLTIGEGDFAAPLVGVEAAFRVSERIDVALGYERAGATVHSEMRDWVTQDDQPIPQATEFTRQRLLGSLRVYVFPRGRTISELAWVPNAWSPYIGGGVGRAWYEFEQYGDFVDFETLDIFEDRFRAEGSGYTTHVMGGVELSLSKRFLVRGEYRHIWGDGSIGGADFVGFNDVDLSGSRVTLGVGVRI